MLLKRCNNIPSLNHRLSTESLKGVINRIVAYFLIRQFIPLIIVSAIASPSASIARSFENRFDSVAGNIFSASTEFCENFESSGEVTSCVRDILIVETSSYNAWARSGRIFITRRLVEVSSEDELAYVIAHELAHVVLGHSGSSIRNEIAADYLAARIMRRSGFDVSAAKTVLARLQTRRILGFPFSLLTHPPSSRRLRAIDQAVNDEAMLDVQKTVDQVSGASLRVVSASP